MCFNNDMNKLTTTIIASTLILSACGKTHNTTSTTDLPKISTTSTTAVVPTASTVTVSSVKVASTGRGEPSQAEIDACQNGSEDEMIYDPYADVWTCEVK